MVFTVYKVAPLVFATLLLVNTAPGYADSSQSTEDPEIETVIVTATRQETDGFDLGQAWANLDASDVERLICNIAISYLIEYPVRG